MQSVPLRGSVGLERRPLGEGKLQGVRVEEDDTVQSGINSYNNVNKAVYGIKAREVLAGTPSLRTEVPEPITEFIPGSQLPRGSPRSV